MDRRGFEPLTSAVRGLKNVTKSYETRIENSENRRIIDDFADFMKVDLRLKDVTITDHLSCMQKFFDTVRKPLNSVVVQDIRGFLKENSSCHYVKAVRVFFGKYLGLTNLVRTFKVPQYPFKPKYVPSKEELQAFYKMLNQRDRVIFLLLATSGLRYHEVMELRQSDLDLEKKMIKPLIDNSSSKRAWVSFFDEETKNEIVEYLNSKSFQENEHLFSKAIEPRKMKVFKGAREKFPHITPKVLREWFCCEMARLGVQDRYVDAFCGRVPRSILARHYTDFSPEKLKEIYDKANLNLTGLTAP